MTSAVRPSTAETVREHILSFVRAYNSHDAEAVVKHLTDDVQWIQPMTDEPVTGRAAAREQVEATLRAMPDLEMPLDDVDVFVSDDGRKAVATFRLTGTMTGPMEPPGFAPTGHKAEVAGVCVYDLRHGLISRHHIVFDALQLAQDLGLLPRNDSIAVKALVTTQRLAEGATKTVTRLVRR